jgi:hypothetical protein
LLFFNRRHASVYKNNEFLVLVKLKPNCLKSKAFLTIFKLKLELIPYKEGFKLLLEPIPLNFLQKILAYNNNRRLSPSPSGRTKAFIFSVNFLKEIM